MTSVAPEKATVICREIRKENNRKSFLKKSNVKKVKSICETTLVVFLLFLGSEISARFFIRENSTQQALARRETLDSYHGKEWTPQYFKDIKNYRNEFVYQPYSLWRYPDYHSETINVDSGFRKTVNISAPPEGGESVSENEIWFIGGSTTLCLEVPDQYTMPSQFSAIAAQHKNPIRVKNLGVGGFHSGNELHLLIEQLKSTKTIPSAIVFYDGVNEYWYKGGSIKPFSTFSIQKAFCIVAMVPSGW